MDDWSRARHVSCATVIAMATVAFALMLSAQAPAEGFPHAVHKKFFPLCEGCHAGVVTGVSAKVFPHARECASCHDGVRRKRVTWQARVARASNLKFSHGEHRKAAQKGGKPATCHNCHGTGGLYARMDVGPAQSPGCMICHAPPAEKHLSVITQCRRCHVPVARATNLASSDVARFSRPDWHESPTFNSDHGRGPAMAAGVCAVCHARESCERCHANANQVPQIKALDRDPRVARLEAGKAPAYFAPVSHVARTWSNTHGSMAVRQPLTCSNCHVRSSCTSCHQSGTARTVIAQLPAQPPRGAARLSVTTVSRRVHAPDMVKKHGAIAAVDRAECAQCHSKQQCAACHAGAESRAFHDRNYSERHAPDVYAGSGQCQSCHNTETFCRACHTSSGVAAAGSMNAAFHNGQAMWVLAHGQAARLGLQACAACHRQNDCVRCHSATGGWGVNPHRAGFNGNRMAERSPATCRLCHVSNPQKGN